MLDATDDASYWQDVHLPCGSLLALFDALGRPWMGPGSLESLRRPLVERLGTVARRRAVTAIGEQVARLRGAIDEATADYVNGSEVTRTFDARGDPVRFDIKGVLLLGAISGSDCLLTGRTGMGKTHLAKMVMAALFGTSGYFNKTITPGMSASDFLDIDFAAIQREGKTLREAMRSVAITRLPGVVLNEPNRAPELVQAILIPFFDHEFEAEGQPIELGIEVASGGRYQYRILTINEGQQYTGVVSLDRAVRDRMIIEIPMDHLNIPTTDVTQMLQKRASARTHVGEREGLTEAVLAAYQAAQALPVTAEALELLVYLNGLGNCIRSTTGTKNGIAFTAAMCGQTTATSSRGGCRHFGPLRGICGSVGKPSARALLNLQAVARAVAMLRLAKSGGRLGTAPVEALGVTEPDVLAAAPLVLFSKLQLDPAWVAKVFQGNKWHAIAAVVREARGRLARLRSVMSPAAIGKGDVPEHERQKLRKWIFEEDPWLATWPELFPERTSPPEGV